MKHQRWQSRLSCCLIFVGSIWLGVVAHATSESKLCLYQFRQKLYQRAARCFQEQATSLEKQIASGQKKKPEDRAQLGALLRNASLAYRKLAAQTKKPAEAAYMRELALAPIETLLKGKYYEDQPQRRLALQIKERLETQIGYIKLLMVTNDPNASIKLDGGYQFKPQSHTGQQWRIKLRPGTYMVLVQYPKQALQSRQIVLRQGQSSALLQFTPKATTTTPKPAAKGSGRVLPWVLVGGGAALALVGGILLGVSASTHQAMLSQHEELEQQRNNASSLNVEDTRELRDLHNRSNAESAAGIAVGSTGLALIIVGVIVHQVAKPTAKAPPTPPSASNNQLWPLVSRVTLQAPTP